MLLLDQGRIFVPLLTLEAHGKHNRLQPDFYCTLQLETAKEGLFRELVFSEIQEDIQHSDKNSLSGQTTVANKQPNILAQPELSFDYNHGPLLTHTDNKLFDLQQINTNFPK